MISAAVTASASSVLAQARAYEWFEGTTNCEACSIKARLLLTLPTDGPPRPVAQVPAAVRIDRRGRYWVLADGPPRVYSADGSPLPFVGPFDGIQFLTDAISIPGDSVLLVDAIRQRATIVDPTLRTARSVSLPFMVANGVSVRWPDSVLMNGNISTPDAAGFPLHIVSFRDTIAVLRSSFAPGDGSLLLGSAANMRGSIAPALGGGFWSADVSKYRLFRWSSTLKLVDSVVRNPSWLPPTDQPTLGGPNRAPSAAVAAVEHDSTGLVWVYVRVPGNNWRGAWPQALPGMAEVTVTSQMLELLYATAVEVIDPERREVIAHRQFQDFLVGVLPGQRAVFRLRGSTGEKLQIVQLNIAP